jgi:hypothetical protein
MRSTESERFGASRGAELGVEVAPNTTTKFELKDYGIDVEIPWREVDASAPTPRILSWEISGRIRHRSRRLDPSTRTLPGWKKRFKCAEFNILDARQYWKS